MTEEFKKEDSKIEKCTCAKELFTKLSLITTGAFVGCLLALCVFNTFARPTTPLQPAPFMLRPAPQVGADFGRPDRYEHYSNRHEFRHDKFDKKDIDRHQPQKQHKQEAPLVKYNKPSK